VNSKYDHAFYKLDRTPNSMLAHNQISWDKLWNHLALNGKLHYQTLVRLAEGHKSDTKTAPGPASFVRYCIRSGWLKVAL